MGEPEMSKVTEIGDDALLARMLAGDEDAFVLLYRRRHPAVYRYALHMSGNRGIAEDVTQEVFMALIRDAKRFDPARGALGGFLIGIARNHLRKRWEQDRRLATWGDDEPETIEVALPMAALTAVAGLVSPAILRPEGQRPNRLEMLGTYRRRSRQSGCGRRWQTCRENTGSCGAVRSGRDELRGGGIGAGLPDRDGAVAAASGEGDLLEKLREAPVRRSQATRSRSNG